MESSNSSEDFSTNPTTQPSNLLPNAQRFSGLNSFPHRFMASQVRCHCPRTPLVRTDFAQQSGATVSAQDEDCNYSLPFVNGDQGEHPSANLVDTKFPSSGLHQLKINRHTEWARSMSVSMGEKQTAFNNLSAVVPYLERCLDPTLTMSITMPSSSGLHPNNVFNSCATVNVKSAAPMGNSSMQGRKSGPLFGAVTESLLRESTDGSNLTSLLSSCLMKSSNKSVVLNSIMDQSTQAEKSKCKLAGNEEEFYRSNPRSGIETQKRISESSSGDMTSCQCKKIRCMKLYCECFASGSYCTETCSCQGCLNVKECDNEVVEARELVITHNPLAFATKAVQHSIEPSASGNGEDGTCLRASSARHIKGCSCKKSMCLKKYCECHQSKVGCSDGCRCEGCRNVYGQNGEKGLMKSPLSGEENKERAYSPSFDGFNTNDSHKAYLGTDQNSNPLSHSSQEDEESKYWLFYGNGLPPLPQRSS